MNVTVFGLILDVIGASMLLLGGFYGDRAANYMARLPIRWGGPLEEEQEVAARMDQIKTP